MKPITKQSDKKTAFTIIELLTVMSIIIILIGLLVPSLNMVKRYAKEVRQKAQFHSIESAMELFSGSGGWDGYPPSSAQDDSSSPQDYCGAMKLCEAMVGQDLMGFHPNSRFRKDLTDGTTLLYDKDPTSSADDPNGANLKLRKTYLQQNTDAYRLWQLYGVSNLGAFAADNGKYRFVLCDVYNRVKNQETGKGIGMPILYYKANTLNTIHDPNGTFPIIGDDKDYIYNYTDNDELVNLGLPWDTAGKHPLNGTGTNFYKITQDKRISITTGRPYRPDSYILISAGFDGMYGTDDDVFNFEK
jgi:type II secretory pathway pseudopilin PulG